MDNIDILPRGIVFWRSMTQWIGGIGIIFFTLAILPAFGVGEVKLFAAESTGPLQDKIHPRISVAVRWIVSIYLGLTLMCIAALWLCGMSLFDAVNHGLATIGTGIAVGGAAPAAIGAVSENDKAFTKALIFVALGEGVAIYGLLISILILFG